MFQPKNILVPMDFSEESMLALDWAVMLSKQTPGCSIYPVYVFSVMPDIMALDVGRADYKTVTESWVKDRMANLPGHVPPEVPLNPVYATGNPADVIAEICRVKGIELIVTTTHGRQGLSHLLHPSVAEALVRFAPCPVLVLHMNREVVAAVHP